MAVTKLAGGLKVVECYGDFVPGLRIDNSPASRRMIFVLQNNLNTHSYSPPMDAPSDNKPTANHLSPKLTVCLCKDKAGQGVFAVEPVEAGEVVVVWGGHIVPADIASALPPNLRRYVV